jgi:two-component sensor histidine kinase
MGPPPDIACSVLKLLNIIGKQLSFAGIQLNSLRLRMECEAPAIDGCAMVFDRIEGFLRSAGLGDNRRAGWQGLLVDFVFAAALVVLAFSARSALGLFGGNILIFAVCYPFLMLATLVAGLRCGLITLGLTTLMFWWAFVSPGYSFELGTRSDGINIALYLLAGGAVVWISHLYRDVVENFRAQKAQNELLIRELHHRSKNSVAVISSIVKQSLKDDRGASEKIIGRLNALKSGDDMLLGDSVRAVGMADLLRRELNFYDLSRVSLSGPDISLDGSLAKTICMIAHELATNAVKYGAWSNRSGVVDIAWSINGDRGSLVWTERDGPRVLAPPKAGFGTFLIERLLTQHSGQAELAYPPSGFVCSLTFAGVRPVRPQETSQSAPASNDGAVGFTA